MTEPAWPAFAADLAATLPQLVDGDAVILEHDGRPAVQFMMSAGPAPHRFEVRAEVFAGGTTPERLAALGWRQPPPPYQRDNWATTLAWPFSGRAALALARQIVDTLRQAHAVPAPDALDYRAFNVLSHADLDLAVLVPLRRLPRH
jgi:hypothetical protein